MEHLMVEVVQARMSDLRAEADQDRLVHLARAVRRAAQEERTHHNRPSLVRRVLALR